MSQKVYRFDTFKLMSAFEMVLKDANKNEIFLESMYLKRFKLTKIKKGCKLKKQVDKRL